MSGASPRYPPKEAKSVTYHQTAPHQSKGPTEAAPAPAPMTAPSLAPNWSTVIALPPICDGHLPSHPDSTRKAVTYASTARAGKLAKAQRAPPQAPNNLQVTYTGT